jgi:hypothetical protein
MRALIAAVSICCLPFSGPAIAQSPETQSNPAASGFDDAGSDARAIEVADQVMVALGGRSAWDATRHVRWRFFGRRLHLWDKHTGNVRIEGEERDSGEPYVILMNINSKEGRAWLAGEEITEEEELEAMLDRGEAIWINDSYWLFMPFKLKDGGVTLRYLGEEPLGEDRRADVLELTFRDVGRTPENKYHVYVSQDRRLVEQWTFFDKATDPEPRFTNPWGNWRRYGSILLSDDRGDGHHSDLAVFETLPESVYRDPSPVDWAGLE